MQGGQPLDLPGEDRGCLRVGTAHLVSGSRVEALDRGDDGCQLPAECSEAGSLLCADGVGRKRARRRGRGEDRLRWTQSAPGLPRRDGGAASGNRGHDPGPGWTVDPTRGGDRLGHDVDDADGPGDARHGRTGGLLAAKRAGAAVIPAYGPLVGCHRLAVLSRDRIASVLDRLGDLQAPLYADLDASHQVVIAGHGVTLPTRRPGSPADAGYPAEVKALIASATLCVVLAGCTATAPSATPPGATSSAAGDSGSSVLAWSDCEGDFQCATLEVPLAYDSPGGPTIGIDVIRLPASGERRGSLVVNPGGPGSSGVTYASYATAIVGEDVRRHYDIVGFDPRGVGGSSPVDCVDDAGLDRIYAMDGTPDTPGEVSDLVAESASIGAGCAGRSADMYSRISTSNAARDMDLLREALGDERLNYLGKSYGTYLGTIYAEMFPARVGRFVLDGALPPDLDAEDLALGQAIGFESALRRFAEDCDARGDCPLPDGVDAGVQRIRDFIDALDSEPLPTDDGRQLTQALGTYAILMNLYLPSVDWPNLRGGLSAAFAGDGSVLMGMLDERIDRQDGRYLTNSAEAFFAISCLDRPTSGGATRAAALAQAWSVPSPTFGAYLAWGNLTCDGWPATSDQAPHRVTDPRIPPIMVVSTTFDPATPYAWGVDLARMLPGARLVTWEGDGHTAYRHGSGCVDAAVEGFIVDGELPASDISCR